MHVEGACREVDWLVGWHARKATTVISLHSLGSHAPRTLGVAAMSSGSSDGSPSERTLAQWTSRQHGQWDERLRGIDELEAMQEQDGRPLSV